MDLTQPLPSLRGTWRWASGRLSRLCPPRRECGWEWWRRAGLVIFPSCLLVTRLQRHISGPCPMHSLSPSNLPLFFIFFFWGMMCPAENIISLDSSAARVSYLRCEQRILEVPGKSCAFYYGAIPSTHTPFLFLFLFFLLLKAWTRGPEVQQAFWSHEDMPSSLGSRAHLGTLPTPGFLCGWPSSCLGRAATTRFSVPCS